MSYFSQEFIIFLLYPLKMSENQRLYGIFRGIETKLFCQGFLSQTMTIHRAAGERRSPFLFSRHLFATLHARWSWHIFNRAAFNYYTATRWDSLPYWITTWLMIFAICFHFYNLKNVKKYPWKSVTFSKVAGWSLQLYYIWVIWREMD